MGVIWGSYGGHMRIILSLMEVLWCHMGIKLEAYGGYTGVMWGSPKPPGTSTSTLSSSSSSPPSSVLPPPLPPPPPPQASPPLPRSLPTHCIAGAVGCPCLRAPRRQGGEQGGRSPQICTVTNFGIFFLNFTLLCYFRCF